MTEPVAIDRPSVAKPVSRPRSRKPATVSASAIALHLDCSRTYIGKLEAESVIQRQGDGFPLDQSRVAYLRYLRRERQQSPRTEADAAHAMAKTELLQIRIEEKKRTLVRRDASAPKSGAIPTSGAIWWRCGQPRFRPAIHLQRGGRESGEVLTRLTELRPTPPACSSSPQHHTLLFGASEIRL